MRKRVTDKDRLDLYDKCKPTVSYFSSGWAWWDGESWRYGYRTLRKCLDAIHASKPARGGEAKP